MSDTEKIPRACPNCGAPDPPLADPESGDMEKVKCESCGWVTDVFETIKAGDKKR